MGDRVRCRDAANAADRAPPGDRPADRTRPPRRADRALDRCVARSLARRAGARSRDGHGHPVGRRPDRVPGGGRVQDRARRADGRHRPASRASSRARARASTTSASRSRTSPRRCSASRSMASSSSIRPRAGAPRARSRSCTRARVTASSSSSSRRPAARRGSRSGSEGQAGFDASSENISGSSPGVPGGRTQRSLPGSSSTRKSTFHSRNGCSISLSIRSPASISAVTISPRP